MIDKKSNIPYYIQIAESLLDKINKSDYKIGSKIPTENELSNLYGVSRVTVREAIKELVQKNRLEVLKGKGMYVKPTTLTPLYGIESIASFSHILSGRGYKITTRILDLRKVYSNNEISKILSIPHHSPIIYFKRVRLLENEPAILTNAFFKYDFCADMINIDLSKNGLFYSIENILKIKIEYLKRIIEPDISNTEQSSILNIEKKSPVLYMQSFIYTKNNYLFGYVKDFFKKEFARFEFDINTKNPNLNKNIIY